MTKMRTLIISASFLLSVLLLPACKGNEAHPEGPATRPLNKTNLTECKCGTPEADIFGCTAACALGAPCDNPLCTCDCPKIDPAKKAASQPASRPAVQKMDGTGYTGPGSWTAAAQTGYSAYMMKNGTILKGTPVKREGDKIRMKMSIRGGGSVTSLKQLSEFSPNSAYNILRKLEPGHDLMSHIALAKFALENGLIAATKRELHKARPYAKEDGRLDEFDRKVKAGAARILKKLVHEAMTAGDLKKAHRFGDLLFTKLPDQMTEAEKEAMLSAYERAKAGQDQARKAKTSAQAAAKRSKEEARILKPIEDRISKADKRNHKGLVTTSNQSSSLKQFNMAIKDYSWSLKRISTERRNAGNKAGNLVEEFSRLERRSQSGYIEANLNAGSIYLGRSSLNNARKNVNNILAIDPKNSRALSMRGRIEIAGNRDWGYGWGGRGRMAR